MARLKFSIPTGGEIALTAATAKTILQARAPANQALAIRGFSVAFDGTSGSGEPVLIELLRQTTNGGMASAANVKDDPGRQETIQTVGVKNATTEPTAGDILRYWNVHPQTGYERTFDYDDEIIIPGGTKLGLRCTAPANVNVAGHMIVEE